MVSSSSSSFILSSAYTCYHRRLDHPLGLAHGMGRWLHQIGRVRDRKLPTLFGPGHLLAMDLIHCLQLRREGDPVCDAVVRFLGVTTGQDALKALLTYITDTPREEWDADVATFWESIARDPPEGVSAVPRSPVTYDINGNIDLKGKGKEVEAVPDVEFTPDEAIKRLNRRPEAILSEGQAVFWRYSSGMLTTLLHFSLAGGEYTLYCEARPVEMSFLTSSFPRQASHLHVLCRFSTKQAI